MRQTIISDILSGIFLSSALVGIGVHASFTTVAGPIWDTNHFVGLWLCGFLAFFSLQTLIVRRQSMNSRCSFVTTILYFASTSLFVACHFISYCLSGRKVGMVWSGLLLIVHVQIFYCLVALSGGVSMEKYWEGSRCWSRCAGCLNWAWRLLTLICVCLTLAGAVYQAQGSLRFPARGNLYEIAWDDGSGKVQTFHSLCKGPKGSNTILIDTDVSHAMAKFYGIQDALVGLGRRVCITDKPGVGHASYLYASQENFFRVYPNYLRKLRSLGEGPFVLAMEGGGAEMGYWIATRHSHLHIQALILVDAYPPDYEFQAYQFIHNATTSQVEDYRREETSRRELLVQIIKAMGCPWALMSIFFPSKPDYQKILKDERYQEYLYNYRIDKTWASQYYVMGPAFLHPSDQYKARNLSSSVQLGALISRLSEDQVRKEQCSESTTSSKDCRDKVRLNNYSIQRREDLVRNLGPASASAKIAYTNADGANMEWFWLVRPEWTAKTINELW